MKLEEIVKNLSKEERKLLMSLLRQYQEQEERISKEIEDYMKNAFDPKTHKLKPEYYDTSLESTRKLEKDNIIRGLR